jgi:methionyl-tRNA formyltransferase
VLFGGDRPVSARIVELMVDDGATIVGLGLNAPPRPGAEKVAMAAGTDPSLVFYGRSFASRVAARKFRQLRPQLGVCCGFAPILPREILELPEWGWVNVHRSYLPFNRGLDPLQWALIDGTPAGVTIHVMTEQVDAGPILIQSEMPTSPTDNLTALEERADRLVFDLFCTVWPRLKVGDLEGVAQDNELATYHTWEDCKALRRLDLNATMKVRRVLDILRGYSGDDFSVVEFQLGLEPYPYHVHTAISHSAKFGVGRAASDDR